MSQDKLTYCQDEDCPFLHVQHNHTNTAPMLDNLARKADIISPLLPGLEREVTLRMSFIEWMCGEREHPDTGAWFDRPEGAGAFWWRKAIRAEISRLKGEGSGS